MSKKELPPPVTKNSSKKDLWDELQAARDEIDAQQAMIHDLKNLYQEQQKKLNIVVSGFEQQAYQLNIIRQVLSAEVSIVVED